MTRPTASLRCLAETLKGRGAEFRLVLVVLALLGALGLDFFVVRRLATLFSGKRILLLLILSS